MNSNDFYHIVNELSSISSISLGENVRLSDISYYRIGGRAKLVINVETSEDLIQVIRILNSFNLTFVLIGHSTNLLFDDEGLDVPLIIFRSKSFIKVLDNGNVKLEASAWVPCVARQLAYNGFTGFEHISGIPGTVGGLVYMNGGSQRKSIGDNIIRVKSIDMKGQLHFRSREQCEFTYRNSIFQRSREFILEVEAYFPISDSKKEVRREVLEILRSRRLKFPKGTPNCGSVFKSNPELYKTVGPPGKVIEKLGFKGYQIGNAKVSEQHANFIVNVGGAKCSDVLEIIKNILKEVKRKENTFLEVEPLLVSKNGVLKTISLRTLD